MSSKLTLILKGSGFRVLQTVVSIIIGVLMMPFLVATLGQELYGLWIVIGSIVGTYYLLDLGFNQAITRYVSTYIHQNKPDAANQTINTALVIYSLLGFVVLLASVLAAQFGAEKLMSSTENLTLAKTILMITGLSFALEFPAKAFPGIISAYMRYDFISLVRLSKSIIDACLIYFFISHGYGLVAMALITLVTGVVSTAIYVKFTTGLFKELRFSRHAINLSTLKDVFHFSKWVFVIDISAMLRDKMDIWFIAYYINNAALTIYYVALRLVEYALQFLTQATGITGPIFTEYYAKGEAEKLTLSVTLFVKLNIVLGTTAITGFYLLGTSFIDIWMRGSVDTGEAFSCLVILSLGRITIYFTNPLNSLLLTLNKHFIDAWITLAETIFSAILCWFLVPYGIKGVAVAIAIPYIVGRLILLPIFTAKWLPIKFLSLAYRISIFWALTALTLQIVTVQVLYLKSLNLMSLILIVPLIVFCQMLLGVVLLNSKERKWLFDWLDKKRQKNVNGRHY